MRYKTTLLSPKSGEEDEIYHRDNTDIDIGSSSFFEDLLRVVDKQAIRQIRRL